MKFNNRKIAGILLSKKLKKYLDNDPIILSIPSGGVKLGYEISKELSVELDVLIVRKLRVPSNEKISMGAITWDQMFLNQDQIANSNISRDEFQKVLDNEKIELEKKTLLYRGSTEPPNIFNRVCILVDDQVKTGTSMKAAIMFLKQNNPLKIIIAAPLMPSIEVDKLRSLVDEVVVLNTSNKLNSINDFYTDFTQTTDEEVIELLRNSKKTYSKIPDNPFINESNLSYT